MPQQPSSASMSLVIEPCLNFIKSEILVDNKMKLQHRMAEREGFEPSVELPLHSISNAAP